MKLHPILPLLAACALLAGAPASAAVPAPTRPAAAAQNPAYDAFVAKFQQAMQINAIEEMERLVKQNQPEAVLRVDYLCQRLAEGPSEALEKEIAAMRRAWQGAVGTKFVDKMYDYYSLLLLDPKRKAERSKLYDSYNSLLARFEENRAGGKEGPKFELHGEEFRGLAEGFAGVGDHFYAGRAWNGSAVCYSEENRGKDADKYKACEHFGKALHHFDQCQAHDARYFTIKEVYERMVAEGFGERPDPSAPMPGQPASPEAAGQPLVVTMAFEPIEDIEAIERPNYNLDDLYQMWPGLQMTDTGSTATFSSMQSGSPRLVRTGPSKVGIDDDADGTPETELVLTGNPTLVRTAVGRGGDQREWAFVFRTGVEQDNYQGLKSNLAPSQSYMTLFFLAAASMTGTVEGVPIRVIDENCDGVYGGAPLQWGWIGLTDGLLQPEVDSIVVGASKRARPWSELQKIGERWYKLESLQGGTQLQALPMKLETGTLVLDFKGLKPDWVVVQGVDKLSGCMFDLVADGKKGVEVPAGEYQLGFGIVREGKKQQTSKALILPGERTPTWRVPAGGSATVQLGAPFDILFDYEEAPDKVVVKGKSVTVVGVGGERYERLYNATLRPEVSVRKEGGKRGSKGEQMPVVLDIDELTPEGQRRHDYADVWRPLDLELELKQEGEAVELQLSEKKHRFFGKLQSSWR